MRKKKFRLLASLMFFAFVGLLLLSAGCEAEVEDDVDDIVNDEEAVNDIDDDIADLEPIKIGALLDMTGPAADLGPLFKNGVEMALEEFNYEVAGRPVELIVEDSATDPPVALEMARKLVEVDGVDAIVGPLMGDAHLSIAPYLEGLDDPVIFTSLFNGLTATVEAGHRIQLIYPKLDRDDTYPLGTFAYEERGHETMVAVISDYAGGHAYMGGVIDGFEDAGGTVVQELLPSVGTTDFGPYIAAFEEADCVAFFLPNPAEVSSFISQYREFGIEMDLLATTVDGDLQEPVMEELGDRVVGMYGQAAYLPNIDTAVNNQWVEAMKGQHGVTPSGAEQNAYTMAKTILMGLEETGGDSSYEVLWPTILGLSYETPQGPLSFTPEGIAVTNVYIVQADYQEGSYFWEPVKIYEEVTPSADF